MDKFLVFSITSCLSQLASIPAIVACVSELLICPQHYPGDLRWHADSLAKTKPLRCARVEVKLHGIDLVKPTYKAIIGKFEKRVEKAELATMSMARQLQAGKV